jgi:hypothetical protein
MSLMLLLLHLIYSLTNLVVEYVIVSH